MKEKEERTRGSEKTGVRETEGLIEAERGATNRGKEREREREGEKQKNKKRDRDKPREIRRNIKRE